MFINQTISENYIQKMREKFPIKDNLTKNFIRVSRKMLARWLGINVRRMKAIEHQRVQPSERQQGIICKLWNMPEKKFFKAKK